MAEKFNYENNLATKIPATLHCSALGNPVAWAEEIGLKDGYSVEDLYTSYKEMMGNVEAPDVTEEPEPVRDIPLIGQGGGFRNTNITIDDIVNEVNGAADLKIQNSNTVKFFTLSSPNIDGREYSGYNAGNITLCGWYDPVISGRPPGSENDEPYILYMSTSGALLCWSKRNSGKCYHRITKYHHWRRINQELEHNINLALLMLYEANTQEFSLSTGEYILSNEWASGNAVYELYRLGYDLNNPYKFHEIIPLSSLDVNTILEINAFYRRGNSAQGTNSNDYLLDSDAYIYISSIGTAEDSDKENNLKSDFVKVKSLGSLIDSIVDLTEEEKSRQDLGTAARIINNYSHYIRITKPSKTYYLHIKGTFTTTESWFVLGQLWKIHRPVQGQEILNKLTNLSVLENVTKVRTSGDLTSLSQEDNSLFTAWATIQEIQRLINYLSNTLYTKDEVNLQLSNKQDTISDLSDIRTAANGAILKDGISTPFYVDHHGELHLKTSSTYQEQPITINKILDTLDDSGGWEHAGGDNTLCTMGVIKNKCRLKETSIKLNDLNDDVKTSLNKANSALLQESDPTVPAWAKQTTKPTYTANEVGALPANTPLFSGSYNDLSDKPTIPTVPTNVSAFTNDAGYLTQHQDISGKIDKVSGATNGNLAELNSNGEVIDSGISSSEVVISSNVRQIITLTQEEFDALTTYNNNTEYNII